MNHYLQGVIHVLGVILGGCVGMWMGAVAILILRLVRGALWIMIVGHSNWPSWAESYQDGMFILALMVGARAGAKFAHGYLQKEEDNSPQPWK